MTSLQERLEAGKFVVTTEMEPPKGTDLTEFSPRLRFLKAKSTRSTSQIISARSCA